MKGLCTAGATFIVCLIVGCQREPVSSEQPREPVPITVEDWRELPVAEKYDESTFDRLKLQYPELKDDPAWHRFMIQTVIPERKKDIPDDLPG